MQNLILGIFNFWCRKLGLFKEEEFLSVPGIGLLSSSKLNFRDLGRDFWLGETLGKSNPRILKLISFGRFAISSDWRRIGC